MRRVVAGSDLALAGSGVTGRAWTSTRGTHAQPGGARLKPSSGLGPCAAIPAPLSIASVTPICAGTSERTCTWTVTRSVTRLIGAPRARITGRPDGPEGSTARERIEGAAAESAVPEANLKAVPGSAAGWPPATSTATE